MALPTLKVKLVYFPRYLRDESVFNRLFFTITIYYLFYEKF